MSMCRSDWVKEICGLCVVACQFRLEKNRRKRCILYTVKITLGEVLR